jgi:predicted molibdopterin-dependent oxidoreductase YjgC
MSRHSKPLDAIVPEGFVEINPADAERLQIKNNDWVMVSSRRGEVKIKAMVTETGYEGLVFIPFHFKEAAANLLTISALDPVAKIPELKVCAVKVEKI